VRTKAAWLLLGLALAGLVLPAAGAGSTESASVSARHDLDQGILIALNAVRQKQGLRPLRTSPSLAAAARAHSLAMARRGFFAHESPSGHPFWHRLERFYAFTGYRTWAVGENLAWRSPDLAAAEAVRLWLGSPTHRRIMLDPKWREVGLAAIHARSAPGPFSGGPVTIVTADFGLRLK